ncbi:MAG: ATP-dependent Clp protease proteolytic subunit [Sandaracinaceae bacterium]|nr:ATP-dependent Clp protease proteolytic subunit [Sandaracinaceae bacterium]
MSKRRHVIITLAGLALIASGIALFCQFDPPRVDGNAPVTTTERTERTERTKRTKRTKRTTTMAWDTYKRLLEQRIVVVKGEITADSTTVVIAAMLFLDKEAPGKDITLVIDSPGGEFVQGMAILDTMRSLKSPVGTVCIGHADGIATMLLASGKPRARLALTHASMQLVPLAQAAHVSPDPAAMRRTEAIYVSTLAQATGRTESEITEALVAHRRFDAEGARDFGLVDQVWTRPRGDTVDR